jgi:tRNA pseudouridine32 synthase / 23S rRNA pseudouridine746 synthase
VPGDTVLPGDVYPSTTTFERLDEGDDRTLLAVHPVTGRRHQIRVHLAWIGHALVGDPLFEKAPTTRVGLHSWRLGFTAPDGTPHHLEAPPREDFRALAPGGGR